jgi:hypothetical protein
VFPKIGEILAECFSILNILMAIGFLASILSEIGIYDVGIKILLKYYYNKIFIILFNIQE